MTEPKIRGAYYRVVQAENAAWMCGALYPYTKLCALIHLAAFALPSSGTHAADWFEPEEVLP